MDLQNLCTKTLFFLVDFSRCGKYFVVLRTKGKTVRSFFRGGDNITNTMPANCFCLAEKPSVKVRIPTFAK